MTELTKKITFTKRPVSLFPSYRPAYRIAQILVILKVNSIGGKASLLKLHLFSWALKSRKNLDILKGYAQSNFKSSQLYFGIEPTLNRALLLAVGEGLISTDGYRYSLTTKGSEFADIITSDSEIFSSEKPVLNLIGKRINESKITQLEKSWKNA